MPFRNIMEEELPFLSYLGSAEGYLSASALDGGYVISSSALWRPPRS
ncbi:hypothetical protein GCWU000341_01545 [Oribacterium sp. oral taxon 078 str. F0262]|nr:hypothetical protein GCWU000341_01545 [Oribacterium sp. oral taxon 078 str. F0262]